MGQAFPTDLAALEAAASTIWQLALTRVFTDEAAEVELLRPLPDRSLTGPSFEIEFQLQQDVLDAGSDRVRTMVAVRFVLRDCDAQNPGWRLFIRGDWPDRTDRFARVGPLNARRLRKAFSPLRQPPGTPNRFALPNDDIYLMKTTPPQDLTAQLCLFVLQTDLSAEAGVMQWLTSYVTRNFRIANREAREEIAQDVVLRLLRYKWWTETPQAWRRYVTAHRRAAERIYSSCSALPEGDVSDPRAATEDRLIALIDGEPEKPDDIGCVNPPSRPRRHFRMPIDVCSVREASQLLGLSVRAVYARIHTRQLPVLASPGQFLIPRSALVLSSATHRLRDVVAAVAAARGCSVETARRRVGRLRQRGLSLDQILHSL